MSWSLSNASALPVAASVHHTEQSRSEMPVMPRSPRWSRLTVLCPPGPRSPASTARRQGNCNGLGLTHRLTLRHTLASGTAHHQHQDVKTGKTILSLLYNQPDSSLTAVPHTHTLTLDNGDKCRLQHLPLSWIIKLIVNLERHLSFI